MYGGFVGTETTRDPRDPIAHPTILSGDIGGNDTSNASTRTDNAFHVLVAESDILTETTVDGFVIQAGESRGESGVNAQGGGVYTLSSKLTLRRVSIKDNHTQAEGGAYLGTMLHPALFDSTIWANTCEEGNGAGCV
jgi:hypothetical protein